MMKVLMLAIPALLLLTGRAAAVEPRPMQIDDLFAFQRVSDPQLSPDGTQLVYCQTNVSLEENKSSTAIYLVDLTKQPLTPRKLTNSGKHDRHPRWSPDGKRIAFESTRSGSNQIWLIDLSGGEARQLTRISTDASTAIWAPNGKHLAFVSAVYPEFSEQPFADADAANKKKIDEIAANPVKAKVFSRLFFRHWDSYVEDKRQHLFVIDLNDAGEVVGTPRNVTPGDRDAYPTSMTFSVGDDFCFSPDSTHLIFSAVPPKDEAWSTNMDLCRVSIQNRSTTWEPLTKDNPAADNGPKFSPNGKSLVYRAQRRAGFEADRWELMHVAVNADGSFAGKPVSLTQPDAIGLDRSIDGLAWVDDTHLLLTAEENGRTPIYRASIDAAGKASVQAIYTQHTCGELSVAGGKVAFTQSALHHPNEAFLALGIPLAGDEQLAAKNVSQANTELRAKLDLPRPESVTVKGDGGTPMQMFLLKPPGFDAKKKYPVAFLVHGGPQGAWNDGWSFRWNPEIWAAQGYVVALPNPRGSTGFGQKYVDEISGDWGGKCYRDLMAGADYVASLPYVDKDRMGAAGASFGGYMMNWFAVQTGRFKCLITHCGVWNFDSMYATTEELWFDEWEHGGPPWGGNRSSYEEFSPHRFAGNLSKFKTPTLIIHNDLDFRVPVSEGLQFFTILQRQGIPSRMVNFPDEGHWVTKPKNSAYWHKEVFAWLTKYVPPGGK
ncbi:S9 family peptidase [Tuwongella immobilis]|uniref:Peptidase S9 prolyl oligopeptidase catalytic domain-containing protein n=1 Tax=Tuwongella immobilis TaxID=692036 RepID=A0A6C2YIY6_9BACT|nr:S9 family peptidase [Tuwongella immobilis]VIP01367.1 peptidase s9 : Dipeptidyl aminopeptidase/acylaminoacyl peptidase OS=Singulisphaera acidiphila (strain ATCC BAA-1392 / DSM 18658 / VKM B-2454 / MOB10) GN=Sinac_5836 PE=4 SV=1: PD40: PD40: Peptidase_S9 [Tuwongella immobilis]VTR98194.1 peptidase s9 : Dipeptidyl aminopeptidase/acylaminoacyl peptidase OS=Singulisphaera acidiphila (strain ATCC BAA-1392 / DSM 18658 / VKM B-2454 / MOB10) GN=Sinac_5836 PE=4 SV=1: PD40: PD40: Peptidase_S9 [Tuwongella 